MGNLSVPDFLARLKEDSIQISKEVNNLRTLTAEQLNWKPDENSWSVGQCIDHIINTDRPYFDRIKHAFSKAEKFAESYEYKAAFPGTFLIKAMLPESKMKVKAQKVFLPSMSNVSRDIFGRYEKQQQEMLNVLDEAQNYNINKLKVSSPAFTLMRMRIGDALRVLVLHRRRHLEQAKRVMAMKGFPR
jgi:hypothetical protein